jgi:hypothetical protein
MTIEGTIFIAAFFIGGTICEIAFTLMICGLAVLTAKVSA